MLFWKEEHGAWHKLAARWGQRDCGQHSLFKGSADDSSLGFGNKAKRLPDLVDPPQVLIDS
jgi:hypothetical protein